MVCKDGSDETGFGSKRVLDLLEPGNLRLGQIVIERCSSQDWSEQWRWRWWKLFWYRGMDGYSEADEYGNSKIWRQMRSRQKKNTLDHLQ